MVVFPDMVAVKKCMKLNCRIKNEVKKYKSLVSSSRLLSAGMDDTVKSGTFSETSSGFLYPEELVHMCDRAIREP